MGYRLYKEVNQVRYSRKIKGKGRSLPDVNCEWETLATNLGEFLNISVSYRSLFLFLRYQLFSTIYTLS